MAPGPFGFAISRRGATRRIGGNEVEIISEDPGSPWTAGPIYSSIARFASASVVLVGAVVLAGWAIGNPGSRLGFPNFFAMKANTALCFVLAGVSLWLQGARRAGSGERVRTRRLGRACAAVVALVGGLTLFQYLFGRNLGIDQALFADAGMAVATPWPGRMAPNTAAGFLLAGLALLLLNVDVRRGIPPAEPLMVAAGTIGLLALIGHAFGVHSLYVFSASAMMGAHTASCFLALLVGAGCARPVRGLMKLVSSDGAGGVLARRLLPAAIFIPTGLGWLRLAGQRAGLYHAEFGVALGVAANIMVLMAVVLSTASLLDRKDAERERAVEQVRRLNLDLKRHAERVEAAYKELEGFSYSVSHDLRAPLRHVGGFADLLRRNAASRLDQTGMRHLDTIAQAARKMGDLIDALLDFTRMARTEAARARVPLGSLVEDVKVGFTVETKGRRIDWRIGPLPVVEGDPAMLRLVLTNLMSNAVKYTRPRPEARIEIGAESRNGETVVCVRDNGVGFDMQYADKLFGVFQRLHRPEEFEGTGIGLANVRRIVERHGGRTWAEGEVDRGAAFYFSLPTHKGDTP
jgi:signal transduction histidine kinase